MKRRLFATKIVIILLMVFMIWSMATVNAAQQKKGLIIYHNDWSGAYPAVKSELESRGYTVSQTDDASTGLQTLTDMASSLKSGDYLVIYLAGHGSNPRNYGDTARDIALEHFIQFNSGLLRLRHIAPLFEEIANKGVHLTVIDGSCNGGETVLHAMGQNYCAVSTTGVYSPGLTNFPYPSNAMHRDTNPGRFGSWWHSSHMTASWMNGEIVLGVPERINQRLFRNDDTDIARLSLFLRPAIGHLTSLDLGGWNLHYLYCYLYRYIYPDDYAALSQAEKNKFTNSLQSYLATIHAMVDPSSPFITELNQYLNNSSLLNRAAKSYTARYSDIWKTLANDPSWNITADPGKYAAKMKYLSPDAYKGEAGFLKIAGEIEYLLLTLQSGFQQQETLLKEIDTLARDIYSDYQLPDLSVKDLKPIWPPEPGVQLIQYNQHQRTMIQKALEMEQQQKIDWPLILGLKNLQTDKRQIQLAPQQRKVTIEKKLEIGIDKHKYYYKPSLIDKIELSKTFKKQKLETLIGKFKAVTPALYFAEGRLSFLLSIFEDAINNVESNGEGPGASVFF